MNLSGRLLKLFGWKVSITGPDTPKCLICVAPHTSNWDFVIAELAYWSVGRKAGFLMKSAWFFWPMGCLMRKLGGVPVERKNKSVSLTDVIVEKFKHTNRLQLAITPEGTRSRNPNWHTGFLQIAWRAQVPIQLGVFDFENKEVVIHDIFTPTGDMEADMKAVKNYYKDAKGKYPEKFAI